jgi:hypothetical protein
MATMTLMTLSDNWEDFDVPELVIPLEPEPVHSVKLVPIKQLPIIEESPKQKETIESGIREKENHKKELDIAFARAKQKYIDYQLKTVYTTYKHMNAIGKKKTMAKIMNEIKTCKNAGAILIKLQIQTIVDTGGILGGCEFG